MGTVAAWVTGFVSLALTMAREVRCFLATGDRLRPIVKKYQGGWQNIIRAYRENPDECQ
jgi:hypothetical protein